MRGIVINKEGFFIGIAEWPDGPQRPDVNLRAQSGVIKEHRSLLSIDEYVHGCEKWRWDEDKQMWRKPCTVRWLVRGDGSYGGAFKVWLKRLPELPRGCFLTQQEPPLDGPRPYWGGDGWRTPRQAFFDTGKRVVGPMLVRHDYKPPRGWKEVTDG